MVNDRFACERITGVEGPAVQTTAVSEARLSAMRNSDPGQVMQAKATSIGPYVGCVGCGSNLLANSGEPPMLPPECHNNQL